MKVLSLTIALAATLSAPALAEERPLQRSVHMAAHPGYFSEHCAPLEAGDLVEYRVVSPHAVDFNVHFHAEKETRYPVKKKAVTRDEGRIKAGEAGGYCFMWTNKEQRPADFEVELTLTPVAP
jgi:hypothetical protein